MNNKNEIKKKKGEKRMKAKKISLVLAFVTVLSFSAGLFAADLNLVNPDANAETKCLYNYMLSIYKTKTLAGQDTVEDSQWLRDTTGKYPAIAGFDMTYYSSWAITNNGGTPTDVEKAIAWHRAGGIVHFQWHWYAPADNIGCWYKGFYTAGSSSADCGGTNFDVSSAINNPGSAKYNMLITDIDMIAAQLKRLQDAGVPVLWRPLHEAEGGWFWWGAKGADACKKLYYLMYDRLTNHHKLTNLIWVWTINCCSTSLSSNAQYWYPGNDRVDINAVDLYLGAKNYTTAEGLFNQVEAASGYRKMAAIAEAGNVPDAGSKWLFFSTWNGTSFIRNPNQNEPWHNTAVFNDAQVITRDELSINCGPTFTPSNTPVPTSTPTPYPVAGRIECENYKAGGEGIGYHDTDSVNEKGQYRTDGVDIETCADAGGGYNVAQIEAGEWMAYSINVLQAGTYNMTIRAASLGAGGTFRITFAGVTKGGVLSLPDTGGWQTWQNVTVPVVLSAGVQEMRIVVDTVNAQGLLGNLNYVEFTAVNLNTATLTPVISPTATATATLYISPTFTATPCLECGTCMIENAYDCNAVNNWGGEWYSFDDKGPSNGGSSTVWPVNSDFKMSSPGKDGGADCAVRMTGFVTTQYPYGFIGIGAGLFEDGRSANLTGVTGIRFWVKGDGKTYQIKLINGNTVDAAWNYYRAVFSAPEAWTQIELPFSAFTQDAGWGNVVAFSEVIKDIKALELQTVGQPHSSIDVWLDNIQLYGADVFNCPVFVPTNTPVIPTNTYTGTNTPVPPTNTYTQTFTRTNTPVPPTNTYTQTFTKTETPVPPTPEHTDTVEVPTNTPVPPTPTPTGTEVPPTAVPTTPVPTNTSVPPTAVPTTPVPTNTSVPPTAIPTNTIAVPTFTATVVAEQKFTIHTRNIDTSNNTNCPKPQFRVINNGSSPLNLNTVELRYWFNCDCAGQNVQAYIDWAGRLPQGWSITSNVSVSVMPTNKGGQTHYLSVKFNGDVTINPGEYAEVQSRLNKSDWSSVLQSNDWSYPSSSAWLEWPRVTGYMNGRLAYGNEPVSVQVPAVVVNSVITFPNPATSDSGANFNYSIARTSEGNASVSLDNTISVPDSAAKIKLAVYTMSGRLIWSRILEGASFVSVGEHSIKWDGKSSGGRSLSAGTYTLKVDLLTSSGNSSVVTQIIMFR